MGIAISKNLECPDTYLLRQLKMKLMLIFFSFFAEISLKLKALFSATQLYCIDTNVVKCLAIG